MSWSFSRAHLVMALLCVGSIIFGLSSWLLADGTGCSNQGYAFINQSLRCDQEYTIDKSSFIRLQSNLEAYILEQTDAGNLATASVFIRDLNNGPTLGMNDEERFAPASLLKVPLLITYLELQEEFGPSLFRTELEFQSVTEEYDQLITPDALIRESEPYTVEELLSRMIIYSDNRAYLVLREYLHQLFPNEDRLMQTFVDLGVVDPVDLTDQTLSTKMYATIFRQLYHASYLRDRASSDWALKLLSESEFNDGLVAGVPEDVLVSHKFGERFDLEGDLMQLHDCGIVYFPDNPYLICVMTRGYDMDKLERVISGLSKIVYGEFEARRY